MNDSCASPPKRRWRYLIAPLRWAATVVLAALLASFALNGFSASRAEAWVTWHVSHRSFTGSPASCSDTAWLQATTPAEAQAYNVLKPEDGISYSADNTTDGSDQTAWAQEYPNSNGQAWIDWSLPARQTLRLACVEVGYTKDYTAFERNERLKSARISFPGSTCAALQVAFPDVLADIRSGSTADFAAPVAVPINCKTQEVRMTIEATYPATDGSDDLAISGISLYRS